MRIVCRSTGRALVPRDEHSEEVILGLSRDVDLVVNVFQERNAKQLRAIHALLGLVAKNHPEFRTVEAVKKYLKVQSKMFDPVISRDGKLYYMLKSIAIESMDQAEFSQVWSEWRQIVCTDLLPGITNDQIAQEILERL